MIPASVLTAEFQDRGYRADTLYADDDPANRSVDTTVVWRNRTDRYPAAAILGPTGPDDAWTWGDSFEHEADVDITAPHLADLVLESIGVS